MITVKPQIQELFPSSGISFYSGDGHRFSTDCKIKVRIELDFGPHPVAPINIALVLRLLDPDLFRFKDGQFVRSFYYPNVDPNDATALLVEPNFSLLTEIDEEVLGGFPAKVRVETYLQERPTKYWRRTTIWNHQLMPVP